MHDLWTEAYRPKTLDGYVFKDKNQEKKIRQWIANGSLPHMLLSGGPGTGKSTLIKALLNELEVHAYDILEVNASKDNGVEFIRDTVAKFSETMGYGNIRYIFLDEADGLSHAAQGVLRGTIEKYSSSVRFLLTCNYPQKIIPALHSRTETGRIHIDKLDTDEFTLRLCNILMAENVEIDMEIVDTIVGMTYPDLRRGISVIQHNTIDGCLVQPADTHDVSDYILDMVALFRAKKYKEARTLICTQAALEEYVDIYRFMYRNLDIWSDDDSTQDKCILVIRDGLVKHTSCADAEMNLSATLTELSLIAKGLL